MSEKEAPYISLGNHLKYVREQSRQSLAEVSGAVEIDETHLANIEAGLERPDEEVLLLLISHFGVQDREAVQLWELANYDSDMPDEIRGETGQGKQTIMLLAMDVRTMYSDGVEILANQAGITMNFTQATGTKHTAPVARVGMSQEQAEIVLKALEQALLKAKYTGPNKLLPPTT
ncbi:MAG TPA: helix-turn-helix transcriptional regulator [Candidatus Saccharimonadia bacterium]|nr:helix-turn-helix transcriptional regulator [Candidatus Saccharimonadia bacterium]